jgi:hypothetical protein
MQNDVHFTKIFVRLQSSHATFVPAKRVIAFQGKEYAGANTSCSYNRVV